MDRNLKKQTETNRNRQKQTEMEKVQTKTYRNRRTPTKTDKNGHKQKETDKRKEKYIYILFYMSCLTCHMSHVSCHLLLSLTPTATARDPTPGDCMYMLYLWVPLKTSF